MVNGQLDAALAVMRQLYSTGILPAGTEANTAKVRADPHCEHRRPIVDDVWTVWPLCLRSNPWSQLHSQDNSHRHSVGMQEWTAVQLLPCALQVEQELLELWSSVEKEKAAARERAHVARRAGKAQLRRARGNEKARAYANAPSLAIWSEVSASAA